MVGAIHVDRLLRVALAVEPVVAFESDDADCPQPPMKLLPNLNVENMVRAVEEEGQTGLVFLVSGEVTAFLGENYLLPRAALRRIDAGNLRQ